MCDSAVEFRPIGPEHLDDAAKILIEFERGDPEAFYYLMGRPFISNILFREFIDMPGSFGYAALYEGRLVGFALATDDTRSICARILKENIVGCALTTIKQSIIYPTLLPKKAVQMIKYLNAARKTSGFGYENVSAELFSFHLLSQWRSVQIANSKKRRVPDELFMMVLQHFKKLNITQFKSVVMAKNYAMRLFYRRYGQGTFIPIELFANSRVMYLIDVNTAINHANQKKEV